MRPFGVWFGLLAMAGACLAGAGCGGGDVPDPDSDSRAASAEQPGRVVDRSAPPAEAPAAPEPAAQANNTPPAEAPAATAPTPAASATATPDPGEKSAPPLKGDSSATEEMLRIAGTPSPTPPAGEATPGGSAPGASTSPAGTPPGLANVPGLMTSPGGSAMKPMPGSAGGPGPGGMASPGIAAPGLAGDPRGSEPRGPGGSADGVVGGSGFGGAPGLAGTPGAGPGGYGSGSNQADANLKGAAAFRYPNTAVAAFLAALKAKDKDRLAETTADRAPTEADEKHRKIFAAIKEMSISDDELDEIAKSLEGFQVVSMLPAQSTRRIGVVIAKMSGRDRFQRTIVTRQERDGWKVVDIEKMYDFKLTPMYNRGRRIR